jgi:peptide-methionine (S)-S-oxide reductase
MKLSPTNLGVIALAGVLAVQLMPLRAAEATRAVPPPAIDAPLAAKPATATAVLAGGCFWGVEGVYEHVKGVQSVQSGYAGGSSATAHYEVVGSGLTGHAESVEIRYDPSKISYGKLLQVYFSVAHNPTELNRQGPDSGTQYRSTIFARDAEQARIANAYVAQLNAAHVFPAKVVTTIESGKTFYPAEGYHQNYLRLNPDQPYIVYNDLPKIAALKATFPALYRPDPAG